MSKTKRKSTPSPKKSAKTEKRLPSSSQDKRAAKKAVVLGTHRKSPLPLLVGIVCAAVIAVTAFYYFGRDDNKYIVQNGQVSSDASGNTPSQISYPVSMFEDGNARHFKYNHNEFTIKYFILKSSDGVIRAAFDACDVCWRAGKGYYQSGDFMVCRNCGRQFASVLVNEVKGGCNPAPLSRSIQGDQLVIRIDDIIEGKQFFDFSGRTES